MGNEPMKSAGNFWGRLSLRERRLATLTGAVIGGFLLFSVVRTATSSLREMDNEIGRLQDDIINCANQMARREAVEEQYAKVAAQHSSAWSEPEIHDRLRQEIYRLAKRVPPALDARGVAVDSPEVADNLVEIPSLGKGEMAEGGAGYRQYRIPLRIPAVGIAPIINFLERLQQSPQSLRVDKLELYRMPESDQVAASVVITRTIADGTAGTSEASAGGRIAGADGEQNPSAGTDGERSAGTGRIPLSASDWSMEGCRAELVEVAGAKPYLEIRADTANATAELGRRMPGAAAYEAILEISSNGKAELGMAMAGDKKVFPDSVSLKGDGAKYRYQVQFGVPGDGAKGKVACPRLLLAEKGTVVQIHNILLRKMVE
jgi:hypothetical protein